MISKKPRGSLTKRPRRTGIFGSGPSDLDLTIRTYPDLDLILGVDFGSNESGRFSRGGGGAQRRRPLPTAERVGNSPDFTEIGAPGIETARVRFWDDLRDTRDPPVHLEQGFRAWTRLAMARGRTARRRIAGARVRAMLGVRGECKRVVELAQGTGTAVGVYSELATADCGYATAERRRAPFRPLHGSTVVLT